MLHHQVYNHSVWADIEKLLPTMPNTSVAHLRAAVTDGQGRWGIVKNVRRNVLIQFFDMDVCRMLSHRRPIRCMESDCMIGFINKSLHERHCSL